MYIDIVFRDKQTYQLRIFIIAFYEGWQQLQGYFFFNVATFSIARAVIKQGF